MFDKHGHIGCFRYMGDFFSICKFQEKIKDFTCSYHINKSVVAKLPHFYLFRF